MTTVGLIGSGNIGITVAQLAVEAGHQVVLSNSRGAETLTDTVAQLGPRAAAATSEQAAVAGDIIVVAVPVKAFPDLPAAPLAGKTIIDTCNYGPERDGHIPELDSNALTSSELLLRSEVLPPDDGGGCGVLGQPHVISPFATLVPSDAAIFSPASG